MVKHFYHFSEWKMAVKQGRTFYTTGSWDPLKMCILILGYAFFYSSMWLWEARVNSSRCLGHLAFWTLVAVCPLRPVFFFSRYSCCALFVNKTTFCFRAPFCIPNLSSVALSPRLLTLDLLFYLFLKTDLLISCLVVSYCCWPYSTYSKNHCGWKEPLKID